MTTIDRDQTARGAAPADLRDLTALAAAQQALTEDNGGYGEELHGRLRELGLYRLLVPHRYGGTQGRVGDFFDAVLALTRGCPSAGWMFCLGAGHALLAGALFDEQAQDELFADPDFVAPATVVPSGSGVRDEERGGWWVEGTWRFCSGAPYATWLFVHVLPEGTDEPLLVALPRADWRMLDDWGGVLGLRGSGSNSVEVRRAFVPDRRAVPGHVSQLDPTRTTLGERLHGSGLYGGRLSSFLLVEDAALAVGMALGAMDTVEEALGRRRVLTDPDRSLREDPDYQRLFGEAAALVHTAQAALSSLCAEWDAGGPVTRESVLRTATVCRETVALAWRAVEDHLVPLAGTGALRSGSPMERRWRDMSMQHSHAGIAMYLGATVPRQWAQAHWGLEVA